MTGWLENYKQASTANFRRLDAVLEVIKNIEKEPKHEGNNVEQAHRKT